MNIDKKEILGKTLEEVRKLHPQVRIVKINDEMTATLCDYVPTRLNVYISGVEVKSVTVKDYKGHKLEEIEYGDQNLGIITECYWG